MDDSEVMPTAAFRTPCAAARAAGLAAVAFALAGCAPNVATTGVPQSAAAADPEPQSRRGELRRTFVLTGQLEAVTGHPVIVPQNPAWQVSVRWILDDGATVEAGDKVAELDTTQIAGDVAQKRIDAEAALGVLQQKRAEVEVQLADKQFAVTQAATADEKARLRAAVPEELVDRRQYQENRLAAERTRVLHENAVADLEAYREASQHETEVLRIALDKSRREIERAEQALAAMVLRAPRSGIFVVGEHPWEGRKVQVGDTVFVGLALAEVPDLSEMRVRALLSDVDDGEIAPGMRATCTVDAYPDQPVGGVVREIGAVAQEERGETTRRHFQVLVELERSDPRIMRPGMSVKVEVETARRDGVLLAPRESLLLDDAGPRVLLADGTSREIVLGECDASACEVLEGLEEGLLLGRRG